MLNHTDLMGRLAQDPVIRYTQSGTQVASFDLAVQVPSKDKNTPADFIPIVCWSDLAKFAEKYLSKGRQIVVEGRIRARRYVSQDGAKHKVVEVVAARIYFADSRTAAADNGSAPGVAPAPDTGYENAGFTEVEDDELPF